MFDETKASYFIVRHKVESSEPSTVVAVFMGRGAAEHAVERFNDGLTEEEKAAGWSHFLEKTTITPGTDPKVATEIRRGEYEIRRQRAHRRRH